MKKKLSYCHEILENTKVIGVFNSNLNNQQKILLDVSIFNFLFKKKNLKFSDIVVCSKVRTISFIRFGIHRFNK